MMTPPRDSINNGPKFTTPFTEDIHIEYLRRSVTYNAIIVAVIVIDITIWIRPSIVSNMGM